MQFEAEKSLGASVMFDSQPPRPFIPKTIVSVLDIHPVEVSNQSVGLR